MSETTSVGDEKAMINLFVGGLPPSVDDEALESAFRVFGPVKSAKVMLDVNTAVSRGFGFVLFENAADAENVLAKAALARSTPSADGPASDLTVHGHRVDVVPSQHPAASLVHASRTVYVRNVPTDVELDRVRELLCAGGRSLVHATVGPTRMRRGPRSHLPRRGGGPTATNTVIAEFAAPDDAAAAVRALHATRPFPQCQVSLLAKLGEGPESRSERLRTHRERGRMAHFPEDCPAAAQADGPEHANVSAPAAAAAEIASIPDAVPCHFTEDSLERRATERQVRAQIPDRASTGVPVVFRHHHDHYHNNPHLLHHHHFHFHQHQHQQGLIPHHCTPHLFHHHQHHHQYSYQVWQPHELASLPLMAAPAPLWLPVQVPAGHAHFWIAGNGAAAATAAPPLYANVYGSPLYHTVPPAVAITTMLPLHLPASPVASPHDATAGNASTIAGP